jgi:hypothetical protein
MESAQATLMFRWLRKPGAVGPVEGLAFFVRGIIMCSVVLQQKFVIVDDAGNFREIWRDVEIDTEASET